MKTNESCVMVFVTPQSSCARLIEAGAEIAEKESCKETVVSIINTQFENKIEELNELYAEVEKHSANMNVYFNNEPVLTAAVVAKRLNAKTIITGFPGENSMGFSSYLHELLPDIPIIMIDMESRQYRLFHSEAEHVNSAQDPC